MDGGKGNGIVFLFGALFSLLSNFMYAIADHLLEGIIAGIVLIIFRVIGDELEGWLKKWYQKLKAFWKSFSRDDESL